MIIKINGKDCECEKGEYLLYEDDGISPDYQDISEVKLS